MILTEDPESIAIIDRIAGTNIFNATAKSTGTVDIKFENIVHGSLEEPGNGMSGYTQGMSIHVKEMYGIVNVSAEEIFVNYSDQ